MKHKYDGQAKSYSLQYEAYRTLVEKSLAADLAGLAEKPGGRVVEAASYSLLAGGKRVRPVLLLAAGEMLGLLPATALPFALALEMIHTYSLIHDDLPAMDNDDLRRGQPSCHVVYGEGMAILAGDFLLNRAYETLLAALQADQPSTIAAARLISQAAGVCGMIGGQAIDITTAASQLDLALLQQLHQKKTGALLKVPLEAAACLAGVDQATRQALVDYGAELGLAFQIRDDILDQTAASSTLGKTAGKDKQADKLTYVTVLGLDKASYLLEQATARADAALTGLKASYDVSFLQKLLLQLEVREY